MEKARDLTQRARRRGGAHRERQEPPQRRGERPVAALLCDGFYRVANLEASKRMILLLDVEQLLNVKELNALKKGAAR